MNAEKSSAILIFERLDLMNAKSGFRVLDTEGNEFGVTPSVWCPKDGDWSLGHVGEENIPVLYCAHEDCPIQIITADELSQELLNAFFKNAEEEV